MNAFPGRRRNPMKEETPKAPELTVTTHKINPESVIAKTRGPQRMCPKCGKVKAYHFHVKNCSG